MRYHVWQRTNKSVVDYLKRHKITAKIPDYEDKDYTHFDFSKVKEFQIAMAKELLLRSGLALTPESRPKGFKKKTTKKAKAKK